MTNNSERMSGMDSEEVMKELELLFSQGSIDDLENIYNNTTDSQRPQVKLKINKKKAKRLKTMINVKNFVKKKVTEKKIKERALLKKTIMSHQMTETGMWVTSAQFVNDGDRIFSNSIGLDFSSQDDIGYLPNASCSINRKLPNTHKDKSDSKLASPVKRRTRSNSLNETVDAQLKAKQSRSCSSIDFAAQQPQECPDSVKSVQNIQNQNYVGLNNQGATCYMNSILQTLYFTNAFRKAVYEMPSDSNIALQLQRLFYQLQFSGKSVGTENLTRSFGWSVFDSFIEQDVHEFLRNFLIQIANLMKGSPVTGVIQNLFEGKRTTFIKCKNVAYSTFHQEIFNDVQLVVKGNDDIYMALHNYVRKEIMDGDNKFKTEQYGLQIAEKSVKFTSLPPILHFQLLRFEMDPKSGQYVKINDQFKFFEKIELSTFMDTYVSTNSKDRQLVNYILHAVLVHTGDKHSGHYVVFINPEGDGNWFKFNDSVVTKCTRGEAMNQNFGGFKNSEGQLLTTNAYMLVYIRDSELEIVLQDVKADDIPQMLFERLKIELLYATVDSRQPVLHSDGKMNRENIFQRQDEKNNSLDSSCSTTRIFPDHHSSFSGTINRKLSQKDFKGQDEFGIEVAMANAGNQKHLFLPNPVGLHLNFNSNQLSKVSHEKISYGKVTQFNFYKREVFPISENLIIHDLSAKNIWLRSKEIGNEINYYTDRVTTSTLFEGAYRKWILKQGMFETEKNYIQLRMEFINSCPNQQFEVKMNAQVSKSLRGPATSNLVPLRTYYIVIYKNAVCIRRNCKGRKDRKGAIYFRTTTICTERGCFRNTKSGVPELFCEKHKGKYRYSAIFSTQKLIDDTVLMSFNKMSFTSNNSPPTKEEARTFISDSNNFYRIMAWKIHLRNIQSTSERAIVNTIKTSFDDDLFDIRISNEIVIIDDTLAKFKTAALFNHLFHEINGPILFKTLNTRVSLAITNGAQMAKLLMDKWKIRITCEYLQNNELKEKLSPELGSNVMLVDTNQHCYIQYDQFVFYVGLVCSSKRGGVVSHGKKASKYTAHNKYRLELFEELTSKGFNGLYSMEQLRLSQLGCIYNADTKAIQRAEQVMIMGTYICHLFRIINPLTGSDFVILNKELDLGLFSDRFDLVQNFANFFFNVKINLESVDDEQPS